MYLLTCKFSGLDRPEVVCWISDNWVAGSKTLHGMFRHTFYLILPSAFLAQFNQTIFTKEAQHIISFWMMNIRLFMSIHFWLLATDSINFHLP